MKSSQITLIGVDARRMWSAFARKERLRRIVLSLTSSFLLAASQLHPTLWFLTAVALAPWLLAMRSASRLEAAFVGAIVGTLSASFVVAWIPEALRTLGSSVGTSLAGLLLTAAWAKAPLFAATGLLARELSRFPAWSAVLLLGCFVGAGEAWISSSGWGVPGALIGHGQLPATGVAQLALVGGVPFISGWLVGLNAAIAEVISGNRHAVPVATALAAGWISAAAFGTSVATAARPQGVGDDKRLLLVQPDLPRHARWGTAAQPWVLKELADHTTRALGSHGPVDAIVWPENALTTPIDADPALEQALQLQVDRWQTPLVAGLVKRAKGNGRSYRSSVAWLETGRGITASVDKAHAVPLVEAEGTSGMSFLGVAFGRAAEGPKVEQAPRIEKLSGPMSLIPVLCYEALFPGIVAERRMVDSLAIVNLADDSWVQGDAVSPQLTGWAAFRAIEQRLPLIRVAHGGLSALIDEYGRTVTSLPMDEFGHMRVTLHAIAPPTLSEKIAIASVALVPALIVWCALVVLNRIGGDDAVPNRAARGSGLCVGDLSRRE